MDSCVGPSRGVPRRGREPRHRPLPDFGAPPVTEVALAVAFKPLAGLGVIEIARVWETKFKTRFPKVQQQRPVDVQLEQVDGSPPIPTLSFQLLETPPLPRLWFLNESSTELVQIQHDWFARNWRRLPNESSPSATYPRYHALRAEFERDLTAFTAFIQSHDLGPVAFVQCELSYINHVAGLPDEVPIRLPDVLSLVARPTDESGLTPENASFGMRYLVTDQTRPIGRVHVNAEEAIRVTDRAPLVALTLTARGAPLVEGLPGVLAFLDVAHDRLVRLFDRITRPAMHQIWRKTSGD